jgi:hypothetical protein
VGELERAAATVSSSGVVTAAATGSTVITGSIGNQKAVSNVTVSVAKKPATTWGVDLQD